MQRRSFFALLAAAIASPLAALGITRKASLSSIPATGGWVGMPWIPLPPLAKTQRALASARMEQLGLLDSPEALRKCVREDARFLAQWFVAQARTNPSLATDEATMTTWFADAISHGRFEVLGSEARWRADYDRACRTIALMHQAAMGEVCGPRRGVVEDVLDLRLECDYLRDVVAQHGIEGRRGWKEFCARLSDHLDLRRSDPPQKSS